MTKTLTISDDVYRKLRSLKSKDESFSELFERLVKGRSSGEILKSMRGIAEFKDKEIMLKQTGRLREEKRV